MRWTILLSAIVGVVFVAGCGGSIGSSGKAETADTTQPPYAPRIDPADFTTKVDNTYSPLKPGTTLVYEGKTEGIAARKVVTVTHDTRKVMGVKCLVIKDTVAEEGKLVEQTYDWYAQDNKGSVWYFGEDSKDYKNGKVTTTKGSWEAGVDGAKPGIVMQAHPEVGQSYRQEYYKGQAEDFAKVIDLNGSAKAPYGSFDHAVVTKEWTPLDPGMVENKYYASGIGFVKDIAVKGPPSYRVLVDVKHGG